MTVIQNTFNIQLPGITCNNEVKIHNTKSGNLILWGKSIKFGKNRLSDIKYRLEDLTDFVQIQKQLSPFVL